MQNRLHLLNAEELMVNMSDSLIQKYNVPGPRYTSYPTVPYWEEAQFSLNQWKQTRCLSEILTYTERTVSHFGVNACISGYYK